MKSQRVDFTKVPSSDSSIVEYAIMRGGQMVGTIVASRDESHRCRNGNSTYCTIDWNVQFLDENGRNLLDEDECEGCFGVCGARRSRWPSPARAGTPAEVARALAEAKAFAREWLAARPDYR